MFGRVIDVISVTRRLWQNVRAVRRRPPVDRLGALDAPDSFVWAILPYAARSFSLCIAALPPKAARTVAVAYLYCRMLDTCEDVPATAAEKQAKIAAFVARFGTLDGGGDEWIGPAPDISHADAADDVDHAHLLLLVHADRVDRVFLTLAPDHRALILRLVRRMGEEMMWAVRAFHAQGGTLTSQEQLTRYCFGVLGNPMIFAEELQRLECGLDPMLSDERIALAFKVGEMIQLANITRDLEKDCARQVFYLAELKDASERSAAIVAARRRLLARALELSPAVQPYLAGIPSPPTVSLARGAALVMALFTLAFWQRTAENLGLDIYPSRDLVTRTRGWFALVARGIVSRRGYDAALVRLDRIFGQAAQRIAVVAEPFTPQTADDKPSRHPGALGRRSFRER